MIVMLVHARKGRGTVQGLEEKRAKVPWVLEEVSLYGLSYGLPVQSLAVSSGLSMLSGLSEC